jgi:cyanophycinase
MSDVVRPRRIALLATLCSLTALTPVGGYLVYLHRLAAAGNEVVWRSQPGGTLIVCGGGHVPDDVLDCFLQLAGGRAARIVVIPAYQPKPGDEEALAQDWRHLGIASANVICAKSRAECDSSGFVAPLAAATGVWLTGGDQNFLASTYGDTAVERELKALLERGGVIAGTSAGAAAMTHVMIGGDGEAVTEQQGFDLIPGAVIDQHFFHRNRTQRLLSALANHADLIGMGVDEHAAVVIQKRGRDWSVIGQSYAMLCMPSGNNFPRLEILKSGDSTNIEILKSSPGSVAINSPADADRLLGLSSKH